MKSKKISPETKNRLASIVFLFLGIIFLRNLPSSVVSHAFGISFIIISLYGFLCASKKVKFIF